MKVWIQDMTWEEVEEAKNRGGGVAIVSVGSTEQHGRHLPTGCDSFCARAIAEDVAKKTRAVIAPHLWFGWSPHHMWLPGTITLRPEILTETVVDICKSLVQHGFRKIVIVNGHRYANLPPLQQAAWKVEVETGAIVEVVDIMLMGDTMLRQLNIDPIGHGDECETSHMLFIHPELVKMEKAVRWLPPPRKFHVDDIRVPGDRVSWSPYPALTGKEREYRKKASGGVSGDPTHATKEKGKRFHRAVVNSIVELIEDLRRI